MCYGVCSTAALLASVTDELELVHPLGEVVHVGVEQSHAIRGDDGACPARNTLGVAP